MYITTKDELSVSSIIDDLRKDSKTVPDLLSLRKKIKEMVELDKYHLIDLIYQYLSREKDAIPTSVFEGFLNESLQISEKEGKKILLFAIPVIFLESITTNSTLYQEDIKFSNQLHGIEKLIESEIGKNIKNKKSNVFVHDELIDYFSFQGGFERIKNLTPDLLGEKEIYDDSILKEKSEIFLTRDSSVDYLKFIVGILEVEEDENNYLPNSIEDLNKTNFSKIEYSQKMNDIFIRKGYFTKQIMIGKPSLLMNSLKESLSLFNYMSNLNSASKVFYIEPDNKNILARITIDINKNAINCCFYRVNDLENYIYRIVVEDILISYEDEIKQLMAICTKLDIKYEIVKNS